MSAGQGEDTGRGYTAAHDHKQDKQPKQLQQAKQHKQAVESPAVGDAAPVYDVYGDEPESRRLSAEEAQRVQELMAQGMSAKFARAEVLGEGP
jgi:hypothetical protein